MIRFSSETGDKPIQISYFHYLYYGILFPDEIEVVTRIDADVREQDYAGGRAAQDHRVGG